MSKYNSTSRTRIRTGRSFAGLFEAVSVLDEAAKQSADNLHGLIGNRVDDIKLGLDAFKEPSATARTGMASATNATGQKYTDAQINLAKRLSDTVKLNETQALSVVEELSLELDIPETITDTILLRAVTTYWKERLSLVALLGEIIRQVKGNEQNSEYGTIPAVNQLLLQSTPLIQKLLQQYRAKTTEEASDYFASNAEYLDLWIGQCLSEQANLLEVIIFLCIAGTDAKIDLPKAVLDTLLATQFGRQQHYRNRIRKESHDVCENIRLFCVVLSIASLDLENLFEQSTEGVNDNAHVFKSANHIQYINNALQSTERQQELSPFILAWSSVLSSHAPTQPEDKERDTIKLSGQFAYVALETLKVFSFLGSIFSNELFDKDSKDGSTFKQIFFLLFELINLDHRPTQIKDFDGLVLCLSDLLTGEDRLCELVWDESTSLGQGVMSVLETARGRFPVQFEPLLQLLTALATGGEASARSTIKFFRRLPTLTHFLSDKASCVSIDTDATEGSTLYRSIKEVPFGIISGGPFMMLPAGLEGRLISGANAAQIVQWAYENSGWELCASMLDVFRTLDKHITDPSACVKVTHVKAILDLLQALYQQPGVTTELTDHFLTGKQGASLIPTLFAILEQSAKFQNPPLEVIASCLQCLRWICRSYSQDVWLFLRQSSFLPAVITTTVQFTGSSRVQTSGLASHILTRFECLQGNYAVTLAFLELIQTLTLNAQQKEIWDSKELRCLKAEILYPCLAYIQNDLFCNFESWHYVNIKDRFVIGSRILSILNSTLDDLPLIGGTDPSEYISLSTLQDYLHRNFLYDGGKQLALPLISLIGSGPDLSSYFSKYDRVRELREIYIMIFQGLKFVKSLLRHRKISGGQPSFLEVYMIDRTVGRANASLIQVLTSYNDLSCGADVALISTDILTLLCALTNEWQTRPSFVGYLGTSDQAQQLVSTLVNRVGDDGQSSDYRIALWSLITITLTTQPGLATLFLSNDRVNPVTGVLDNQFKEIAKNSILVKALDILHKSNAVLDTDPEILPHALHFLDVLWQNSQDHAVLIKSLQSNDAFWKDLGDILSRPDIHTELELAKWEDVFSRYGGDPMAQVYRVSSVNAEQRSRGHALRIFGLAIHFHYAMQGALTRDVDSLPKGIKSFIQMCVQQGKFGEWNDNIPKIHYHAQGHRELKEMGQELTVPLDYLKLAVKRWDENFDADHLAGESFMLDLDKARFKFIWGGKDRERAFLRTLFHVNLNWSIVHSEMERLSAWRFFVEVATNDLGAGFWAGKSAGAEANAYYHFVISLLDQIQRDTHGSAVLRMARQTCCLLLQSVIENSATVKRSDKKNIAVHFPEIVTKLQKLIQNPEMGILESIQNPGDGLSAHQPLFLTLLFCYRALHDKEVLTILDQEHQQLVQKSSIHLLPSIAQCFSVVAESYLSGQFDHSDMIVVLLALLEEICHPVWNPHAGLWIPILRNLDVVRLNLQLCARSVSTGQFDSRPSFFEGSLNFLLALANVPEMAAYLCDAGVMTMLTHNGLTAYLQRGDIEHLDEAHGDRGNWHQAWCMYLAIVTGLLRSMSSSDAFMQLLIGFIQLYGNQLSKGLDTSTDRPLTSAKLEEMERITMLFYELSKHDVRLEPLGGGEVLKAFFDRSLFILQHAVHLFTHPHTLASLTRPVTRQEHKNQESSDNKTLTTTIEGKLAAVVRNILSAILVWTDPALILTKSNLEWPLRKTTIAPISNTPVYEPASIGTMFDLVQYATTSLMEWEARLEGKTGGSAGLFKNSNDDDRQNNANASSSTSTANSKLSSRLACFGTFLSSASPSTSSTVADGAASGSASGTTSTNGVAGLGSPRSSTALTIANPPKSDESAFATLSSSTGSSIRMISLLEDAFVVMATQLALYMYHPQLDAAVRREIQDLCLDLIATLNSTQRMLQRFENVPAQARKDELGAGAYSQIQALRDTMIPIIKNFVQTKINVQ
ncbi:MAG: nucleoporin subcomplex protein binding to Pom34-domain-containing protein [Linnemannia gamsii]|nr:MAG: nucleoporin subcomplex protein binding to Pom34-domain-containing protein [Linnemannia gamsii]